MVYKESPSPRKLSWTLPGYAPSHMNASEAKRNDPGLFSPKPRTRDIVPEPNSGTCYTFLTNCFPLLLRKRHGRKFILSRAVFLFSLRPWIYFFRFLKSHAERTALFQPGSIFLLLGVMVIAEKKEKSRIAFLERGVGETILPVPLAQGYGGRAGPCPVHAFCVSACNCFLLFTVRA